METTLTGQRDVRTDLQGLRGMAVLLVVCFHAGLSYVRGAFVAVDVFFVLSGFFLARSLAGRLASGGSVDLSAVYARRVWRLLPALALVLVATLAGTKLAAPIDRAAIADQVRTTAWFSSNVALANDGVNYFSASDNPLLHTWTLGVEYQLVLFLPALMVILAWISKRQASSDMSSDAHRHGITRTIVAGIAIAGLLSVVVAVWTSASTPAWAYFGPHTRLFAFAVGALLAFFVGGGQSIFAATRSITIAQAIGVGAIVVPSLIYDRSMPYPGAITIVPVLGTALLLAAGSLGAQTSVGRVLSASPLTWLGRVSYAWYLWHLPLMVLAAVFMPGIGPWARLACGAFALVPAWLTQKYVEQPMQVRALPRLVRLDPFLSAVVASLVIALAAQAVASRATRFVNGTEHATFAAARADRMEHSCWAKSSNVSPITACAFGAQQSSTRLILLGDSHAEHWLAGLDRAGREHDWRIEARVMGGCPVSDFSQLTHGATTRRFRECSRFREAMLRRIIAARPRAVLLSSFDDYIAQSGKADRQFQVSEQVWREGLRRTYARLAAAGIPMVAFRGTPRVPFDVPTCLSRRAARLSFATDCTFVPDRPFMVRAQNAQDDAARGLGVRFVDMNDVLCATATCATMRNGLVLFTDDNHLTATFTRSVGSVLGDRINLALAESPR